MRTPNRHQQKSGKAERKDAVRGLRRSLDATCDLFLLKRGLRGRSSFGNFRFGAKR